MADTAGEEAKKAVADASAAVQDAAEGAVDAATEAAKAAADVTADITDAAAVAADDAAAAGSKFADTLGIDWDSSKQKLGQGLTDLKNIVVYPLVTGIMTGIGFIAGKRAAERYFYSETPKYA